ncbi:Dihydrosphingosine phosphate lyase [Microsporum audouinii]
MAQALPMAMAMQAKLMSVARSTSGAVFSLSNFDIVRNLVFFVFLLRLLRRSFYTIRGYGIFGSIRNVFLHLRLIFYGLFLRAPGVRSQVDKQVSTALTKLEQKLAPQEPGMIKFMSLPKKGMSHDQVRAELDKLGGMKHTMWEDGRVSGAVYHGGEDLLKLQTEAFGQFAVSNPIHPDVFPGVRKMEAEVVAMVLDLFHGPDGSAGVTTSGGTESILMACLSARQKAYAERGVTEPEMIVPETAHAAFTKASKYFGIKFHSVPCPSPGYLVDVSAVRRLINPNTVLLVGSAPNFPHGLVDDIPALSRLAVTYKIPLHVDCCLGSFVIAFLKKAGFPSPYEAQGGFDFRQPGVTSISVDTHKYGFAPKGSSVVLYRNRSYRTYQYFVMPNWPGGVYASPSMAGSRPGALIAGCWTSMMAIGESGYIDSCHQIISAARKFEAAVRKNPGLSSTLEVVGRPMVSVVGFTSTNPEVDIYDIADAMSNMGWHLNALQSPPAMHVAFTLPTANAVDKLIEDLTTVVQQELTKIAERKAAGIKVEKKRGDTSALYGVAGSIPDKSIVRRLAEGFLDTLYVN